MEHGAELDGIIRLIGRKVGELEIRVDVAYALRSIEDNPISQRFEDVEASPSFGRFIRPDAFRQWVLSQTVALIEAISRRDRHHRVIPIADIGSLDQRIPQNVNLPVERVGGIPAFRPAISFQF